MRRFVLGMFVTSAVLDAGTAAAFFLTGHRGMGGLGSWLVYAAIGAGCLAGLMTMGRGESEHGAYARQLTTTAADQAHVRTVKERSISWGLVLFFGAVLTGLLGYLLRRSS